MAKKKKAMQQDIQRRINELNNLSNSYAALISHQQTYFIINTLRVVASVKTKSTWTG
jgi:hypothetical protein